MATVELGETKFLDNTKLIVLMAIVVCAVVGLLIVPQLNKASSVRADSSKLQSEIAQLSASDELIERMTGIRDELVEYGDGRVAVIPARNDVAGLMTQLSTTFDEVGLRGREMTTQSESTIEDVVKMPMVVRATGRFPQIYDVLDRLENMPRLLRIGRLRLERETRSGRDGFVRDSEISADILIEAFYEASVRSEGTR